jgi:hypothetical protein
MKLKKNILEKVERVNNDLERNWWNYEIYIKRKIEENEKIREKEK